MNWKTLPAALVSLAALAIAMPARAEFPHPAVYIGVYGGGHLVLRDWDLGANDHQKGMQNAPFDPMPDPAATDNLLPTHSGLVGGRLGLQILSQLALEAELAYLPIPSTAGNTNHAIAWDLNLLIHLLKSNWTPVIEAGVGAYHNLSGDLGRDSDPRFHIGLGLRGLLAPWVALRVDVRDVLSDGFDMFGSNNLEVTAGLDFFVWRAAPPSDRDHDGIVDSQDACPDVAGLVELKGCPDRDHDGVADSDDLCPDVAQGSTPDAKRPGCPEILDRDGDGISDDKDACPDVAAGRIPDPKRPGCPADSDGDGVVDEKDQCIDVPAGQFADASRPGCPADRDGDGINDDKDACPDVAAGKFADPKRAGCPDDRDGDGVIDEKDQCIDVPAGKLPDPKRAGCPADSDGDSIPDETDACPDKPGAPDPDPKKNGCPGLVKIEKGQIVILDQVYFATAKDVILPKSFAVLGAVAHAITTLPAARRISVEGHTDNKGNAAKNMQLSQRRADSVKQWLIGKGIAADRIEAKGYGPTRPIAPNTNEKGRSQNRRVEFHISDAK